MLNNPLPGQTVTSTNYVDNYRQYSQLFVSPELSNFIAKSEQTSPQGATIADVYQSFNSSGLYNGKIFQDILMNFMTKAPDGGEWSNVWTTESFQSYLRFVTMNFGLTGMFTYRSPREMIEGYDDPLIIQLSETPVYQGGDQTTPPKLALDNPPTHPKDNPVSFFTGEDNYRNTRRYASWLDSEEIKIQYNTYESISKVVPATRAPWKDPVQLDGTDGMQFQPSLTDDLVIGAFVQDMSRNCYFSYSHDDDTYKHYTTKVYAIEKSLMYNMTGYEPNVNFETYIDGTSNMTSTLLAPAFVAKGHYYDLSPVVESSKCEIVDMNDQPIEASQEADDTYLGMEAMTGVCVIAAERIFYNFQVWNDRLFNLEDNDNGYGKFIPLLFVRREAKWTDG